MVTKPGSWWRQRDPVAERFADAIVPRTAVHWPEHHHPTDAADDIPAPGDVDVRRRIAADAALDADSAFARLDQMQRRMEGQIAAARDWRDDPDNVAWADHPFIGPMLEQGRGDDLMRLADPRHQDRQRAAFDTMTQAALDAAMAAEHSPVPEEAKRFLGYVGGVLPSQSYRGTDPAETRSYPPFKASGYPGGTPPDVVLSPSESIFNAFVQAATDYGVNAAKFEAIRNFFNTRDYDLDVKRIALGLEPEHVPRLWRENPHNFVFQDQNERLSKLYWNRDTPEGRAAIEQAIAAMATVPEERPEYRFGEDLEKNIDENYKTDPRYDNDPLQKYAPQILTLLNPVPTLTETSMHSVPRYEGLRRYGADPTSSKQNFEKGAALGALYGVGGQAIGEAIQRYIVNKLAVSGARSAWRWLRNK